MEHRFLAHTGVRVSALAFGTMSFGGDADEATSAALYAACRDAGVNTFDTANVYNGGRSEELLGRLIAHERDQIVLLSKGYFATGAGPNDRGASRYHLSRAIDASLTRLGTDRIDVYFVHRFDDATALEEVLRGLEDAVRAGKILYPAFSNFAAWQVMKALGIQERHGWARAACIQPMYNLVKRQAEVELLPLCAAENIGCFPYSPLGGGLLTGKFGVDTRPDQGRLVDNPMYQTRYGAPSNYQVAAAFSALAAELDVHPVTLSVKWVETHPAVTAPLLGARNVDQLTPALAAAELAMDDALRQRISALSPTPPPATDRTEERTGPGYGSR